MPRLAEERRGGPLACRAVEHVSFTVPDLEQALAFFVNVLGAREEYRRSYAPAAGVPSQAENLNVHPEASYTLARLHLCGLVVELFQYRAPDLRTEMPRNCDAGGSHIGLVVDDVDAAAARLAREPGVKVHGRPAGVADDHPLRGRRWIYFSTPWGLQLELVSQPSRPA